MHSNNTKPPACVVRYSTVSDGRWSSSLQSAPEVFMWYIAVVGSRRKTRMKRPFELSES